MRISLQTSGGHLPMFNAARGGRTVDVEAAARPELDRLVAAAEAEAPTGATTPVPDALSYTVTVDTGQGPPKVLRRSDGNMTSAFADLLEWFDRNGRNG